MANNDRKGIKGPSSSNQTTADVICDQLDSIAGRIIGGISTSDLTITNAIECAIRDISNKYIDSITMHTNITAENSEASASMLTAIAGYLFEEAGIKPDTPFSQLLSKLTKLKSKAIISEPSIDDIPGPESNAILDVIISGIDSKGLNALTDVLDRLLNDYDAEGLKSLESVVLALSSIQTVADALQKVNFGDFNEKYLDDVKNFVFVLESLSKDYNIDKDTTKLIANSILDLSSALTVDASKLDNTGIDKLNNSVIAYKGIIDNLTFSKKQLSLLKNSTEVIKEISGEIGFIKFDNLVNTLNELERVGDTNNIENILDVLKALNTITSIHNTLELLDFDIYDDKYIGKVQNFVKVIDILGEEFDIDPNIAKSKLFLIALGNYNDISSQLRKGDISKLNKRDLDSLVRFKDIIAYSNTIALELNRGQNIKIKNSALNSILQIASMLKVNVADIDQSKLEQFKDSLGTYQDIISCMAGFDFSTIDDPKYIENLSLLGIIIDSITGIEIGNNFSVDDITEFKEYTAIFNNVIEDIASMNIRLLDEDFIKSFENVHVILDNIHTANQNIVKHLSGYLLINALQETLLQYPSVMHNYINKIVGLNNRIKALEEQGVDLLTLQKFTNDLVPIIDTLNKIGILSILANATIKGTGKALGKLNELIGIVGEIDIKEITANIDHIKKAAEFFDATKTIFISATVCGLFAVPAVIGAMAIGITSKLIFWALKSVINGLESIEKIDEIEVNIKAVTKLILVTGGLMLFAALAGGLILKHFGEIIAFGATLSLFMVVVLTPILLISRIGKDATIISSLDSIRNLIVTCAGVMVLGALFMMTGLWEESLLFGLVLTSFITLVLLPFLVYSKLFNSVLKDLDNLTSIIVTCSLVLIFGALFMKTGLFWHSLGFAFAVTGFIFAILSPFLIFSKQLKGVFQDLRELTVLVVALSALLVLGALFMLSGLWLHSLAFAVMVTAFLWGVLSPFIIFGKTINQQFKTLIGFSIFVAVCGTVLMFGAAVMNAVGWDSILGFGALLLAFVVGICLVSQFLSNMDKNLTKGLIAMAAIVGISMLFGLTLTIIKNAMSGADIGTMFAAVGVIAAIILAIGGLSVALGALSATPPVSVFFWAGIGAMAAVAGIAVLFSVAMKNIAEAAKMISDVSKDGFEISGALQIVAGLVSIGQAVAGAGMLLPLPIIMATSISCKQMARMISEVGNAVAEISNLNVATSWDKNGNPIAFRQLSDNDFTRAAENTKTIISTLGGAIVELYNSPGAKDMFVEPSAGGIAGFFGKKGKTPFEIVVRSCTSMATMISMIANTIADMSNLRVESAWDSNGRPTGYRHLTSNDFKATAANIKEIITTLGGAIIAVYNSEGGKDMFNVPMITEKTWWGGTRNVSGKTTIFEKVVTSCSSMGNMIALIAKGVADIADLRVADVWDANGKPTHYRYLDNSDFKKAGENTATIIKTLSEGLLKAYKDNKDIFDSELEYVDGKLQGQASPILKVINCGTIMGEAISSIAKGVKDIADLRIEEYDANGKPSGKFKQLTEQDFKNVGTNVGAIVTVLASSIAEVYKKNPKMFDSTVQMVKTKDGFFSDEYSEQVIDSPIVKVLKTAANLGTFISECAAVIKDVADFRFEDKDGKKVAINMNDLKAGGKVTNNVTTLVGCLPLALKSAYDRLPKGTLKAIEYFDEDLAPVLSSAMDTYIDIIKTLLKDTEEITTDHQTIINGNLTFVLSTLPALFKKYYSTFKDAKDAIVYNKKNLMPELKSVTNDYTKLYKDLNNFAQNNNVDDLAAKWTTMVVGLTEPFDTIISEEQIEKFKSLSEADYDNFKYMVNSVNSLDVNKVDKFVELATELSNLSTSMGDMSEFINALNGKINGTLINLANKLEVAAETIKLSDKAQDDRQKLIEKNVENIRKAMSTTMKIELKKEDFATNAPNLANNASGSNNTPDGIGGGNGNNNNNNGSALDNEALSAIEVNTRNIYAAISKYLENN